MVLMKGIPRDVKGSIERTIAGVDPLGPRAERREHRCRDQATVVVAITEAAAAPVSQSKPEPNKPGANERTPDEGTTGHEARSHHARTQSGADEPSCANSADEARATDADKSPATAADKARAATDKARTAANAREARTATEVAATTKVAASTEMAAATTASTSAATSGCGRHIKNESQQSCRCDSGDDFTDHGIPFLVGRCVVASHAATLEQGYTRRLGLFQPTFV